MQVALSILLAMAPYLAVVIYLLIKKKISQLKFSDIIVGFGGILCAVAAGAVIGTLIIMNYPQTGSSISNSFLITVLGVSLIGVLIVGEALRYGLAHRVLQNKTHRPLVGLSYGIGFSFGEFLIYLVPLLMNRGDYISWDAAALIAVDVSMQILLSISCYELIKQNNFAFIAVGGLYYLSFFLSYVLHNATALNIAAKVVGLIIAVVLAVVLAPRENQYEEET